MEVPKIQGEILYMSRDSFFFEFAAEHQFFYDDKKKSRRSGMDQESEQDVDPNIGYDSEDDEDRECSSYSQMLPKQTLNVDGEDDHDDSDDHENEGQSYNNNGKDYLCNVKKFLRKTDDSSYKCIQRTYHRSIPKQPRSQEPNQGPQDITNISMLSKDVKITPSSHQQQRSSALNVEMT